MSEETDCSYCQEVQQILYLFIEIGICSSRRAVALAVDRSRLDQLETRVTQTTK